MRNRLTTRLASGGAPVVKTAASKDSDKKRSGNGEAARNTEGFEYDKAKAKYLKKALHNINVSLGTLLAAMKELALLRGSEISPDGMLGGRGFIMPFKEMKKVLNESISDLSDITDTLADELTNPKWGLSKAERKKVKEEKEEIKEETEEVTEEAEVIEEDAKEEDAKGDQAGEDTSGEQESREEELENIDPSDVKDSAEIEAIRRYQEILGDGSKDKVASVISKYIVANLVRGE